MFTSMFALEMLLKLLACGPLGYIQNPYNIFDGVIVVIRWAPASHPAAGFLEAPVSEQSPAKGRGTARSVFWRLRRRSVGSLPAGSAGDTHLGQLPVRRMFLKSTGAVPFRNRVSVQGPSASCLAC